MKIPSSINEFNINVLDNNEFKLDQNKKSMYNIKKYNSLLSQYVSMEEKISHRISEILRLYIRMSSSFFNIISQYENVQVDDLSSIIIKDPEIIKKRISTSSIQKYITSLYDIYINVEMSRDQQTNTNNNDVVFYYVDSNTISRKNHELAILNGTSIYFNKNVLNNSLNTSMPSRFLYMTHNRLLAELANLFFLNFDYLLYCHIYYSCKEKTPYNISHQILHDYDKKAKKLASQKIYSDQNIYHTTVKEYIDPLLSSLLSYLSVS